MSLLAHRLSLPVALGIAFSLGCSTSFSPTAEAPVVEKEVVATGLVDVWDLAFLPDGALLYTERAGRIGILDAGAKGARTIHAPTDGFFYDYYQGGMLGIAVDPEFSVNRYVYTYMTAPSLGSPPGRTLGRIVTTEGSVALNAVSPSFRKADEGLAILGPPLLREGTTIRHYVSPTTVETWKAAIAGGDATASVHAVVNRVVRWAMSDDSQLLRFDKVIVDDIPYGPSHWGHHGGRIRFGPDGYLYVSTGDADFAPNAGNGRSLAGKILRVDRDGNAAPLNGERNDFDHRILTSGHRNPQGIAFHEDGRVFTVEHGSDYDDEVNLLVPGNDYGWRGPEDLPRVPHPPPPARAPLWTSGATTVGPSGATFIASTASVDWKAWDGRLAIATLRGRKLLVLGLDASDRVSSEIALFEKDEVRLRSVIQGPDGFLYVATDSGFNDAVSNTEMAPPASEIWRLRPR